MKVDLTADNKKVTARASSKISGPGVDGNAKLTEYDVDGYKYVHVEVRLEGDPAVLTPGKHAIHIHEKGECECEGFKCAGGHFDPGPYGNSDADANHGYHAGDLPSITINKDGKGEMQAISTRITLSDGPVSILEPEEGTSFMVHGNEDPYTPGESGSGHSGGPRLACGKIERES